MPTITDYLTLASNGTTPAPTTLAAQKVSGASSCSIEAAVGWPTTTPIHFMMYEVDDNDDLIAGTLTIWKGILSGTTIGSLTLKGGTDQTYPSGSVVQLQNTDAQWNDLITGLQQSINPNGSLITSAVQAALGITSGAANGWTTLGYTPVYQANNGNKEFQVEFAGVNLSTSLSPGMKLQVTRGTTPPTECMSFVSSSSQYAAASSPSGITFTGAFTIEAWIYVKSIGATQGILSRDGGSTSGFDMSLTSTGQVQVFWRNASGTSNYITATSVPVGTWVHVAASVTPTSGANIYINGVLAVNSTSTLTGSTVVQASVALDLGLQTGTSYYFNGYMSEVRLWSQAQTQSAIQSNMAISIPPSTSGLIGYWQGNGNFNDQTSNANNLAASGGAIATQVANPYNAIEYGVITQVTYSSPNTTVYVMTGNNCNIPNETLSNAQFSTSAQPYGLPAASTFYFVAWDNNGTNSMPQFNRLAVAAPGATVALIPWFNTGNVGGQFYFKMYPDGVKEFYGSSASYAAGSSTFSAQVNMPSGFMSALDSVVNSPGGTVGAGGTNDIYIGSGSGSSTSTINVETVCTGGSSTAFQFSTIVKGT